MKRYIKSKMFIFIMCLLMTFNLNFNNIRADGIDPAIGDSKKQGLILGGILISLGLIVKNLPNASAIINDLTANAGSRPDMFTRVRDGVFNLTTAGHDWIINYANALKASPSVVSNAPLPLDASFDLYSAGIITIAGAKYNPMTGGWDYAITCPSYPSTNNPIYANGYNVRIVRDGILLGVGIHVNATGSSYTNFMGGPDPYGYLVSDPAVGGSVSAYLPKDLNVDASAPTGSLVNDFAPDVIGMPATVPANSIDGFMEKDLEAKSVDSDAMLDATSASAVMDSTTSAVSTAKPAVLDSVQTWLSGIWDYVKAIPSSIGDVLSQVKALPAEISNDISKFFYPPTVAIDFAPLMNVPIAEKFPFCLPYDFVGAISALNVTPAPPKWTIDFGTYFVGNVKMVLDFAQFAVFASIVRWSVSIGYVIMLILLTRTLMGN